MLMGKIMSILNELEKIAEGSFSEFKTTYFISAKLKEYGIDNFKITNPGVFGEINANKDKTIAIRADIDALPVNPEKTEFKHMCGHHAHITILLEFLKIANKNKEKLTSNIRFIFQPAEEIGKGAEFMIKKGAIEGVNEIYGLHVEPLLKLGEIGLKKGVLLAGAKFFDIEFYGKSTHAALPHEGIDIFCVLADFILKSQLILSRNKDPVKSGVLSIGYVHGGDTYNIIPEKLKIKGTYRFFDFETDRLLNKKISSILESLKNFYGIEYNLKFSSSTVPLINDNKIIEKIIDKLQNSEFKIITEINPMMGSEDFAFYLQKIPGAFIRLGISKGENHPPLHNRNFFVPEETISYGIKLWKKLFMED